MKSRSLIAGAATAVCLLVAFVPPAAHAGLFGESDEEKAARLHEQDQDATLSDLTQRVHDLEESLRRETGQNEALTHQVQQLSDKIERQRKDFEYRLCTLSAQQLGATASGDDDMSLRCGGSMPSTTANAAPPASVQTPAPRLSPPPGILGTLPAGKAAPPSAPAAQNPQVRSQFDAALDLAAKARYEEARAAFRSFADANPDDELAPQAVYWVGDIAFAQKDYANAARAFVEELKKYPTSSRGPDSMLKLGQSLIAMGQVKEGCSTLAALPSKFPAAPKALTAKAASERKASCR